jgi:hypothetical protein
MEADDLYLTDKLFVSGTVEVAQAASFLSTVSGSGNFSVGGNITLAGDLNSDADEAKTLFGMLSNNTLTLGGGGLVATAGDLKVGGDTIQSSGGAEAIQLSGTDVEVKGDLQVTGNDIKSSTGATAITLNGSNVIVAGDLTVNGATTVVNTENLVIKDILVGLGYASGSEGPTEVTPAGDRGFVYSIPEANNVASFWDHSEGKFAFVYTDSNPNASSVNVTSYATVKTYGLSGSLTTLHDGTSYLIAGVGVEIVTGSNGAVTISSNAASTVKGYLAGNSAHISAGVVTFGPLGANLGTIPADDENIDVYLNGVYLSYGYDITAIAATSFTLDSGIASTLTADDIISISLRNKT